MKSSYNINKVWNIENLCRSLTNLVTTLIEKWTYIGLFMRCLQTCNYKIDFKTTEFINSLIKCFFTNGNIQLQ